jgi:hypothetical protein
MISNRFGISSGMTPPMESSPYTSIGEAHDGNLGMCNDFGNRIPYSDYLAAFSQIRVPVRFAAAVPNLEPREDIWPTDKAPVIRPLEDGTNEFTELRWGFPPSRPNHQFPV